MFKWLRLQLPVFHSHYVENERVCPHIGTVHAHQAAQPALPRSSCVVSAQLALLPYSTSRQA